MSNQNAKGFYFYVEEEHIEIGLAAIPESCRAVVFNLPNGERVIHQFSGTTVVSLPSLTITELEGVVTDFLFYLEVNEDLEVNTTKGYRQRLGQFIAWLKTNNEPNIALPETWLTYYANLKRRKLSAFTRKGHYHILQRFGRWLVEKKYLGHHPMEDVQPPQLPRGRLHKAIPRETIIEMLKVANVERHEAIVNASPTALEKSSALSKAAEKARDWALLLFFRDTGCRAEEGLSLRWGEILMEDGKGDARIVGKGNKERPIFLEAETCQALNEYRQLVPDGPDDPVWRSRQGELSYEGLYKIFKRLADRAGIEGDIFSPHAWRHAFGRDTTLAGIPTVQLQDLMGHSSIEVTKGYTQFNTAELRAAHPRYSLVSQDLADMRGGETNGMS